MATVPRMGDLDLEQDLEFEQWQWSIQRIAWTVWGLILLGGLLGLLGPGPLSHVRTRTQDGSVSAEYHRFDRLQRSTEMRIHLNPQSAPARAVAASSGNRREVRLWIAREFMDQINVSRIEPEPLSTEAGTDRFTYVFVLGGASPGTAVTFHYEYDSPGRGHVRLGIDGGGELAFAVFVYP
jgi:hypothetical protein